MFQIVSDSSCDLSAKQLEEAGIAVVPFYITLDGNIYRKEGSELPVQDFYEYCVQHPKCYPKTSMPSVQDYIEAFTPFLEQGKDILCYCITKQFSGSVNSASTARDLLKDVYPEREIRVTDSTLVTGLFGLLLMELSSYAKAGHTLQETWEKGEEIKKNAAIYFTTENLYYLAKGGRLGRLTDLAMRSLDIRPLIYFGSGELHPIGVSRGRKNSFDKIIEIARKVIREQKLNLSEYRFGYGWGYDRDEAEPFIRQVHSLFQETFGCVPEFVQVQIGVTIGVHTGPYPVGFGFMKKALPEETGDQGPNNY